jgi:hypothetical protein
MSKSAADRVIDDPANHYPYHKDRAVKAGVPRELAAVAEKVVQAQEAYLRDPSDENRQARNDADREAQRVSSEQSNARARAAIVQQLADLDAGNQGAHVNFVPTSGDTTGPSSRALLEQQLADLDAQGGQA